MTSGADPVQNHAERLAAVARHIFSIPPDDPMDPWIEDYRAALEQLIAQGATPDEAYQQIYARLSDGVADG